MRVSSGLFAAGVLAISTSAGAQEPNLYRGQAFAEQLCAECHAIKAGEMTSPHADAPPFEKVAKTSGMTAMALSAWMQTSHPTMPNIVLKEDKAGDIIAYILSLKPKST